MKCNKIPVKVKSEQTCSMFIQYKTKFNPRGGGGDKISIFDIKGEQYLF